MTRRRKNPDVEIDGIENMFDAIPRRGGKEGSVLWHFQFGAVGTTNVFVGGGYLEDGLETAAGWLAENAPGHLTTEEEMTELYKEAAEEHDIDWPIEDWDDPAVEEARQSAEADMTYTESGWLTSYEWYVNELHPGDELYNKVWEQTIDALGEEGDLDDSDIEEANAFAEKHNIDAHWELPEENPRLTTAGRKRMKPSKFAVPSLKKLPVNDARHTRNAMARFNQTLLTDDERTEAYHRILSGADKFGIDASHFEEEYSDWA